MKHSNSNFINYIIFFTLAAVLIGILYWGLCNFFLWFFGLGKLWFFVVTIIVAGIIKELFRILAILLVEITSYILPIRSLVQSIILTLVIINCICLWYKVWTIKDDYSGWEIFVAIVATSVIGALTAALGDGVKEAVEKHY